MFILAQVFGALALILLSISYLQKKREKYLVIMASATILYAIQYFLLHALSGALVNTFSTLRNFIFYFMEKKTTKPSFILLFTFLLVYILIGIFTYNGLISLIPISISLIYAYGVWQPNLKVTYFIAIIAAILWIIYNYFVLAYVAVFASIIELIASIIGFIKVIKNKNQESITYKE